MRETRASRARRAGRERFSKQWPPSLVTGLRRRRGRLTMRRPSPRRRSSSCFSCSLLTRRPSRRRVALVSSQLNSNRNKLRPQGQLLRAHSHVFHPMLRRVRRRGRTPASGAVQRAARGTMPSGNSRYTAWLSLSCTSAVYGGGAGCARIWPTSSRSRARRCMRARATRPGPLRLLWGCLARSELTALHPLPPPPQLRRPPVPAVLRCRWVSTGPSARPRCSGRVAPGSSSARQRQRRLTRAACDAHAVAPHLLRRASTGK